MFLGYHRESYIINHRMIVHKLSYDFYDIIYDAGMTAKNCRISVITSLEFSPFSNIAVRLLENSRDGRLWPAMN